MCTVKIIEVRLSNSMDSSRVELAFREVMTGFPKVPARLLRNATVENHWSVVLYRTGRNGETKSKLALRLIDFFQTIGLVHHSLWQNEIPRNQLSSIAE